MFSELFGSLAIDSYYEQMHRRGLESCYATSLGYNSALQSYLLHRNVLNSEGDCEYTLRKEISDWLGQTKEEIRDWLKL